MNEPNVAQTDQLDARLRDLLASNQLELLERTGLDATWISTHSGQDLFDHLVDSALKVSDEGGLSALVAVTLSDETLGYTLVAVRRAEEPEPDPREVLRDGN